jgi:hypothetical protein
MHRECRFRLQTVTNREIVVAKNVQVAHCIWDPVFLDTVD